MELLSEQTMALANSAIDYAANNIKLTGASFTSFMFLLTTAGEKTLVRLVSEDHEEKMKMAQSIIDKNAADLLAYAIAEDAYVTLDNVKLDSILVSVGCAEAGRALKIAQPYTMSPTFQEKGNMKVLGEAEFRLAAGGVTRADTEALVQPLLKAPYAIFFEIAAADGSIDKKEMDAFIGVLKSGLDSKNPFVAACVQMAMQKSPEYYQQFQDKQFDLKRDIAAARVVINSNFQGANGEDYLAYLKLLASKIAQPKGGFMGFGKKVAEEDAAAVKRVEALLS